MKGAERIFGFDKPTYGSLMNPLAAKTQSVNLGLGFPSWQPPQFFTNFLEQSVKNNPNHQYVRAFGSLNYTRAIAEFHKKTFPNLDHQTNITTVFGGVEGLFCSIMGNVNQGDQVLFFDPSYDNYRPQVQMAGGKAIGIPLRPKKQHHKEDLLQRIEREGVHCKQEDEWQFDEEEVEKAFTHKTKLFLLNTPSNPLGKVFSNEELSKLAKIIQKHPQVVVVQDNVYEGMIFDDMFGKPLPKLAFQEGMADRTLSIYSAGKIFSATGVRCGWVIGSAEMIKTVRAIHQMNTFCGYNPLENTITKCLNLISKPDSTYLQDCAQRLTENRDLLVKELLRSKFNIDLWIPKGGYFVIVDISKVEVMEKYKFDEEGNPRTKDWAFAYQLAHQNRVVCIPCSPFYCKTNIKQGTRYVRIAFCKDQEMILEAGKRLRL